MKDNIEEEILAWEKRKQSIREDLEKFAVSMSAVSQVVLIKEMASIESYIKDMRDEAVDMNFKNIISDFYNN